MQERRRQGGVGGATGGQGAVAVTPAERGPLGGSEIEARPCSQGPAR